MLLKTTDSGLSGRILGGVCGWSAVALAAALAMPGAAAQPNDQARQLLAAAVAAHGGQATLSSLGDTTAVGSISVQRRGGAEECAITVKTRSLASFRSEVSCPLSGSRVWITDGRWGWALVDGAKQPLGLDETADSPQVFNPALGALGLFLRGRLEPVSIQEAPGVVVVAGNARGSLRPDGSPVPERPMELDLDPRTGLVTAVRLWERGRDGRLLPEAVEYRYSDWRSAAGLTVPFHVEEFRYGQVVSTVVLSSFSTARHGEIFVEP